MSAPTKPNLPPVPPAPPAPVVKDPSWWKQGCVPFIVLILVVAAADLAWPRGVGIGLGAALGSFLAINALLLLRRDFSRGEYWFLQGLAIINFLALFMCGSNISWISSLVLPFFIVMTSTARNYVEPRTTYRNWWSYWFARRSDEEKKKGGMNTLRKLLPLLICILIGVSCFVGFLCIFAAGNPVVDIVWNTIIGWWNQLVELLQISRDFWFHVFHWIVGFVWFGFYCFSRRSSVSSAPVAPPVAPATNGSTLLPYLPFCVLLGINAAFLIATSTDIAYLWFGSVPEGVSQTAYLHEGATSITWAAVLAAMILVLLFRRNGSARRSVFSRVLGYMLVIQTALLAVSVYMRLYYQIADFGFTTRRIEAAEALLMGLAGLVVLIIYMSSNGGFWKYTKICLSIALLMVVAFTAYSPARMAGTLNMMYVGTHPHWEFKRSDFRIGRFDISENLAFAEYVFNQTKDTEANDSGTGSYDLIRTYGMTEKNLKRAAEKVEARAAAGSWLNYTISMQQDIPAAERILGRPISIKLLQPED
ncbi:MAG: DUF4173 domain-containing protein [Akkermansia sp.]|nr:DUF4173 domain-containing protein [Akkermansia sp.]